MTEQELAELLRIDQAQVHASCKRLEELGLVTIKEIVDIEYSLGKRAKEWFSK